MSVSRCIRWRGIRECATELDLKRRIMRPMGRCRLTVGGTGEELEPEPEPTRLMMPEPEPTRLMMPERRLPERRL